MKRVPLVTLTCTVILFAYSTLFAQSVLTASGPDADSIRPILSIFQARLGELRPNAPIRFPDGRREINWDAVPETFSSSNPFPGNFFNFNAAPRARGIVFRNPDTEQFQVSANPDSPNGVPPRFGNINSTYPDIFAAFSPEKIFSPIGSTITDVFFFLPSDQTTPAAVAGFGAVFCDVDLVDSSRIEYYDQHESLLLTVLVPQVPGSPGSFSFAGASFPDPRVFHVRIFSGNTPLASDAFKGNGVDVVAMDDFIFGEPQLPTHQSSAAAGSRPGRAIREGGIATVQAVEGER